MALIIPGGMRLGTAAGVPISGAKVRVYNANTTTLSTIYSDAAMTVPLTNPVICNSAGYPSTNGTTACLVFGASANYDVAFLDASNNVLVSWEDLPALGSDASAFSKDYTNSRVAFRGVGGTLYLDFGDADPDNAGGTGSIGGWLGTQADLITLNTVLANVAMTTGGLRENSKKLLGHVSTEATAFAAVASVDIELVNSPTGVLAWDIDIWDYVQSAAVNLRARLSYDGAGTFKSGATDYCYHFWGASAAAVGASADIVAAQMELCSNFSGTTARPGRHRIRIQTVNSGTVETALDSTSRGFAPGPVVSTTLATGWGAGGYGRATHLRLFPVSGTFTGKYRVTPLRGFGET